MDLFCELRRSPGSPRRQGAIRRHASCPGGEETAEGQGAVLQRGKSRSLGGQDEPGPSAGQQAGEAGDPPCWEPAGGIVAALRAVAADPSWTPRGAGAQDARKESRYIHALPLYQDYWLQCVKEELRGTGGGLARLLSPPARPRSLRERPCSLWQELPWVRDSGLLGSLSPAQRRQQEAMFEVIASEASYQKSLTVAVDHFMKSPALRQTLSSLEHHSLFSNLPQVREVSHSLLLDLESRLEESVLISDLSDVVLRHRDALSRVYIPYVTNQMYQEALCQRLWQENGRFVAALRKLEEDPVCQRQSLKSFLVLPFQRITRLRILLENILKLSPPGSEIGPSLQEAIAAVHQIAARCEDGVLRMKRTEELVRLEARVDFGRVKAVPLITRGRWLVREGELQEVTVQECPGTARRRITRRAVYLHLFNDLLLLSHREEGRFRVLDYTHPCRVRAESLQVAPLGLPGEAFLLHIARSHTGAPTALILQPPSSADKEQWITAVSLLKDLDAEA
ncbi:ARHG5 factor, partial [Atractosteus spatula]|nr:ARHG5 factor [Atractosteus spatula]